MTRRLPHLRRPPSPIVATLPSRSPLALNALSGTARSTPTAITPPAGIAGDLLVELHPSTFWACPTVPMTPGQLVDPRGLGGEVR